MNTPGLLDSPPRQSAIVYLTAAALAADPGPYTVTRYAVVLDLGVDVFSWALGDTTTADNVNVIAPTSGGIGRWKKARADHLGANLTNADATIYVSGNAIRILPAATLTANHVLTLGTTGAIEGDEILVVRNDAEAFTYTIANGGAGGGNVAVMPVSQRAWCRARYDGTNWIHLGSAIALATA